MSEQDLEALLSVDVEGWRGAVPQIREHYGAFGQKLPDRLMRSLEALETDLAGV